MPKIIAALMLATLLGGCATYTERTSPCVCDWKPINLEGEAAA